MSATLRGRGARVAVALAVALAAMTTMSASLGASTAAGAVVDEVHYTFTGGTSVAVDWRGDAADLQYGTTSAYGTNVTAVAPVWTPWSSPGPYRQVQIAGLQPATTYHYSIGGGPDYTFHTPPASEFRFDAIGDVGATTQFGHLAGTFSAIASDQPSFVLMIGDLTYANAAGATQAVVDQHFNDVMAWSTAAAYMPAWGNHEWESPNQDDLRNYKGRLLMPNAQTSPGSPAISDGGDDWGWFDAGNVRFISYPEPYTGATWPDWQAKASALMSQAQADPSIHYIVTYGHRPAYSTGYHLGDTTLAGLLDGLGSAYSKYTLNINGHSHDYERFQPISGVTHVTVGAPSSEETPWSTTDPRTAVRAFHLSHLRVDVGATGMRLQAICDEAATRDDTVCPPGSVLDEYAIGVPPAAPPSASYYVDKTNPGCSDIGPGDVLTPFCTIAKGSSRLLPGLTLYIGNGSYAETLKPPSGLPGSPVTVTNIPGTRPVLGAGLVNGIYMASKSYVSIAGLTVTGTTGDGVYLTGDSNVTLSGLHVSSSGKPTDATTIAKGMKIIGTTASTVTGNVVDHNTDSGIYLAQGTTGVTVSGNETFANARGYTRAAPGIDLRSGGNTVIGNVSHDNEDSGIQLYTGSDGSLVVNNLIYGNGDHGIDDFQATNQRIIGNSAYRNTTAGINVEGGSTGVVIVNNISVDNGLTSPRTVGNIRVDGTSQTGTLVNGNLVFLHAPGAAYVWGTTYYSTQAAFVAATAQESRGREQDPRWADPDAGNFHLTAGSLAIDSADSGVAGSQPADAAGVARYDDLAISNTGVGPRSYDDRGAYEAPAGTTDASPTAVLTMSPGSGTAPVTITADASASSDSDATPIATYAFNFGDGYSTGAQPSATAAHQYTQPGTYNATVTVSDTAGLRTTTARQVVVGTAGNLVTNSTFETNLTGWASLAGCDLTRVAGGHNEGWTANLFNSSTVAQSCTLNDSPNWALRTVAGTYQASAWIRADTPGLTVKLRLREYVGTTLAGTGTATVTTTGTWQQITLSYPVASPGSTLDLNVYSTNQLVGTNLQVDDVVETSS